MTPGPKSESRVLRIESNLANEDEDSLGGKNPWSYSESRVLCIESNLERDGPSFKLKESNLEKVSNELVSGPSLNMGVLGTESAKLNGLLFSNKLFANGEVAELLYIGVELYMGVLGTESAKPNGPFFWNKLLACGEPTEL